MAQHRSPDLMVGLFIFAAAVGLLTTTALSNRAGPQTDDSLVQISTKFGRIDGVTEGTEVRLAGMPVGSVVHVELLDDFKVDVTMAIRSDVEVPQDSAAVIETDGLFGAKYVEIQPGGEFDMVEDGGRLSFAQDSVIIETLVAKIIEQAKVQRGLQD